MAVRVRWYVSRRIAVPWRRQPVTWIVNHVRGMVAVWGVPGKPFALVRVLAEAADLNALEALPEFPAFCEPLRLGANGRWHAVARPQALRSLVRDFGLNPDELPSELTMEGLLVLLVKQRLTAKSAMHLMMNLRDDLKSESGVD